MISKLKRIVQSFEDKKVLVIGDVMIDTYYKGNVNRISPEAPVPIVNVNKKESRLGGAANVALNIQALGGTPLLCTAIGNDEKGQYFKSLMQKHELNTDGVLGLQNRKTTVKSRILGNQQQLLRLDEELIEDLDGEVLEAFQNHVNEFVKNQSIDAIIFEDYDKGILPPAIISQLVKWAGQNGVPTLVDPKNKHFFDYKNVTVFKPNLKELKEGLKTEINVNDHKAFVENVKKLEVELQNEATLVTLSENGVFIKSGDAFEFLPAHLRNITDVSGAGDTVISVAAMALLGDASYKDLAILSNLAGGLACEQPGVVTVTNQQIIKELDKLNV